MESSSSKISTVDHLIVLEKIMPILYWVGILASLLYAVKISNIGGSNPTSEVAAFVLYAVMFPILYIVLWSCSMLFIGMARDLREVRTKMSSQ
jgi:hypothetical protein